MFDAIDDKIYEIEARVESIIDRAMLDTERRALVREFGQDLIEKIKQGKLHLNKIKRNYRAFKIARIIHPKNGQEQLTKTLDSYEALSTKIKGISDNLNSFINAVYLGDKQIHTQVEKFENNPTLARSIPAGHLKQIKKSLPKVPGIEQQDLEDITTAQYQKFDPFFSYHRNTTQHAKTSQSLEVKKRSIKIPAGTITKNSEQADLVKGLEEIFENYINLTKDIITTISTHDNPHISQPKPDLDQKIANKTMRKEYKDMAKMFTYTVGVLTMMGLPIYTVIQLSKDKDRVESANQVITAMYEAQDNKKMINLTSLMTESNTKSINEEFAWEIRENNSKPREELNKYQSNSACYILKAFKGKEQEAYLELVKLINKTEETTIDSIQKFAIAQQGTYRMPVKYTPTAVQYAEIMHDSLDNLVRKKLKLEKDLAVKYMFDSEQDKNDPILQDVKLAAALTHLCLERNLYKLEEENIKKSFLNTKTIVGLNEDYNETIRAVCDSLDGGFDNLMYSFLVNNTPYMEHLSQKDKTENLDEIIAYVGKNMARNSNVVATSMASTTEPYRDFARIVFSRTNNQRPLRSIVIPIVYETSDSQYNYFVLGRNNETK